MADTGFWDHVARDLTGRGRVRLILQPAFSILLGIRLGIADAREGAAPFVYRLFTTRDRAQLFARSLQDAVVPLAMAFVIDAVLQVITLGHFRPLAALVVGALLVWLPFAVARALTNRVWSARHQRA